MKKKMFIVVILVVLVVGCIGVYNSNKDGMFSFDKNDNTKIKNIENENRELSLKELSNIVFTIKKDTKKVTDMDDLELIHASVGISVKYIDTITGSEIRDILKKYFNIDKVKFVDITCDLPMSDDHDNRMYIYNSKTDKYVSNPDHISHVGANSDGIIHKIVNGSETTEGDFYVYSGQIFYAYNKCGWDICGSNDIYDVYLSYDDAHNKVNKQFNAYDKRGFCSKSTCDENKIYEEIKDEIKTISFYYKKNNDNYVFDHYEIK